ncbi:MAG: NUDIX hydrolase [Bacteroidetes bacterium 43-93]|nr:NUDIX domain-containing protein [Bacteroidota bacterium]OJX01700.1 MAG: NUDIX hydrolase [Bacteroidetes bacterium 43-93]
MRKTSAGILLYKQGREGLQVFLVHPGGPFWKNKDAGAWSIPKGEFIEGEDPLKAAIREFFEETGQQISGEFLELKPIKARSGKLIFAWALQGDIDPDKIVSNTFPLEWPPRSGKFIDVPEIDNGAWFSLDTALEKINASQAAFITELASLLSV